MVEEANYGKRPLWQWVVIYGVVGLVVYGLVYYFVFAKRGDTPTPVPEATVTPTTSPEATISATETSEETVILTTNGFAPATLTVKAGTEVTWSNRSGANATVNSDPHPTHTDYPALNLGSFPQGGTLSLTFDQQGTYKYHNHLSPDKTGTIIVE